MTRSRSMTFLAGAAVPLSALAIAGLGIAGSDASAAPTPLKTASGRPAAASVAKPTIGVRSTRLGKVLVDSRGRTLYLFKKDSGTKSACFGACATAWPPLRASGKPKVGTGVHASAIIKARARGEDWLADRIYSSIPAGLIGCRQVIEIGPMSGESNVVYWLQERGIEAAPDLVKEIFQKAKDSATTLVESEVLEICTARGITPQPPRPRALP